MTTLHDVPHIDGRDVLARIAAGVPIDSIDPVVWPGFAVPTPVMTAVDLVPDDAAGWFHYNERAGAIWKAPDRLYLEAVKVDPYDANAVMDFAKGRGRFVVPFIGARFGDLASTPNAYVEMVAEHTNRRSGAAERDRVERGIVDLGDDLVDVHVDEVGTRLEVLRMLVDHVIRYRDGDYVAPAWGPNVPEDFAWILFQAYTDHALTPFHVGVELTYRIRDENDVPQQATMVRDRASLYSVMVLQLVNDMGALVDFHTCASCGSRFVHQTGRGTGAQHRLTGVKYCSKRCADREQRRRFRQVHRDCTGDNHVCGRTPRSPRPGGVQK